MKIFMATEYSEGVAIEVTTQEELQDLYDTIMTDEEDFILSYIQDDKKISEIIVTTNIISKIKDGTLTLRAKETKKEV